MDYMKKNISLSDIKKIEIEILKKIDMICEENDLKYSLAGGSAIGAIRHKGFIPWDDDIDIMMIRDDYEKLQKIMSETKYKDIKLLSNLTVKNYPYPFIKAVSLNTTAKELGIEKIEDYGVFIDIFPIDKVPKEEKKLQKYLKKVKLLKKIYLIKLYKKQISSNKIKLLLKNLLSIILKPVNLQKLVKRMDKMFKKYNSLEGDSYALIYGLIDSDRKHYYKKEFFTNTEKINFEDEQFYIISEYDTYLKDRYGNYMKLPDESQRVTNHNWEYVKYKNLMNN